MLEDALACEPFHFAYTADPKDLNNALRDETRRGRFWSLRTVSDSRRSAGNRRLDKREQPIGSGC